MADTNDKIDTLLQEVAELLTKVEEVLENQAEIIEKLDNLGYDRTITEED